MIKGLKGSSGYLNTSSQADSDSELEEGFDVERYPDAKQLKKQCMDLNDQLNNRFFAYEPLFSQKKAAVVNTGETTGAKGDSKQFVEPSRPTKLPKAVQILQGIPDQDSQAAFKRDSDQHKSFF